MKVWLRFQVNTFNSWTVMVERTDLTSSSSPGSLNLTWRSFVLWGTLSCLCLEVWINEIDMNAEI